MQFQTCFSRLPSTYLHNYNEFIIHLLTRAFPHLTGVIERENEHRKVPRIIPIIVSEECGLEEKLCREAAKALLDQINVVDGRSVT